MDIARLPEIPLLEAGDGGMLAVLDQARPYAEALLGDTRRRYTSLPLRLADAAARRWLKRGTTPYRAEMEAIAARLRLPGALGLNLVYEWCCTGIVEPDPAGVGARMVRVLDWRMKGLGRYVVVVRATTPAGDYYNVTWVGAVGVLTAMAPGRFSAAIHQAPMQRFTALKALDWARNRARFWRRTSLPPAHLLRQVFETCKDYKAARQALTQTEIALPAIFLLAGNAPDECCVIERLESHAVIHDGPATPANDWHRPDAFGAPHADRPWTPRGRDNPGRRTCIGGVCGQPLSGLGWLTPPVLNPDTRLAVWANAASGTLVCRGIEGMAPATEEFRLSAKT